MKRVLTRMKNEYYYFVDGERIVGSPDGITGDLSDIRGNLDDCEISEAERAAGVDVSDLIA